MSHRSVRAGAALAALLLAATAHSAAAQQCKLEYRRADNMWAAFGRPDGNLGTENVVVSGNNRRVFVTDWKYEKATNDGTNFYGSHLRTATNRGATRLIIEVVGGTLSVETMLDNKMENVYKRDWNVANVTMPPYTTRSFRGDLSWVFCPVS
jgi:hypothetical protein